MSHKATRVTVAGFDLVQLVGAVLLALVAAFVVLGGYAFVSALGVSLPMSLTGSVGATLVFTLLLVVTVVAARRLHPAFGAQTQR